MPRPHVQRALDTPLLRDLRSVLCCEGKWGQVFQLLVVAKTMHRDTRFCPSAAFCANREVIQYMRQLTEEPCVEWCEKYWGGTFTEDVFDCMMATGHKDACKRFYKWVHDNFDAPRDKLEFCQEALDIVRSLPAPAPRLPVRIRLSRKKGPCFFQVIEYAGVARVMVCDAPPDMRVAEFAQRVSEQRSFRALKRGSRNVDLDGDAKLGDIGLKKYSVLFLVE